MSEDDIKSIMLELEEEVEDERNKNLTLEEKLAIQVISVERLFYYSSESIQRKRQIREILESSLRE